MKKSKRNIARRNKLAALRAELTLTLEGQLKPHHLKYNAYQTNDLMEYFREWNKLPVWAMESKYDKYKAYDDLLDKKYSASYDHTIDAMRYSIVKALT